MTSHTPELESVLYTVFAKLDAVAGDLSRLSEFEGTVAAVYGAQGVIDNGGLRFFFENDWPATPRYGVFLDAYRRIGAQAVATRLEQAITRFPFPEPHQEQEMRRAFMASLDESDPFFGEDACGDPDVWPRLEEYVRQHGERSRVDEPRIEVITSGPGLAMITTLFREYAAGLGVDLAFQQFEQELAQLPGSYSAPSGTLMLCRVKEEPVGCVAVRRWSADAAELKRMFVRDRCRGEGYGSLLLRRALGFARAAGYKRILLDTLPSMGTAQAAYRKAGFREIPPYRFNPVAGTAFMELELHPDE